MFSNERPFLANTSYMYVLVMSQVCTEGRLLLEFTMDELMRIRNWHFAIRHYTEMIPRNVIVGAQDPNFLDQLSKNITRQGMTNVTLNYLRVRMGNFISEKFRSSLKGMSFLNSGHCGLFMGSLTAHPETITECWNVNFNMTFLCFLITGSSSQNTVVLLYKIMYNSFFIKLFSNLFCLNFFVMRALLRQQTDVWAMQHTHGYINVIKEYSLKSAIQTSRCW